jgi:monoamine oxidase
MNPLSSRRRLHRLLSSARRLNAQAEGRPVPVASTSGSTRRRFLKAMGLGAAAVATAPILAAGSGQPRIAIIGGGLAGLNAALTLKKHGLTSTVYEARQRMGGRVFSVGGVLGAGTVVNFGGELVNTDHADILELAAEFGVNLVDRLADAEATGIEPTALLIDGQQLAEADLAVVLRRIAGRITRDAAKLDRNWDRWAPVFDALSVSDYLDQNADVLEAPYLRSLLEQLVRSEFGAEPEESSAIQLLFILPVVDGQEVELLSYSDERYFIEGGSSTLTNAMASSLGNSVKLGRVLVKMERTGGAYRLKFRDHPAVTADIVIVTAPNTALRNVDLDIPLPAAFRSFVNEVGLGVNEKVTPAFSRPFWRTDGRFAMEAVTSHEAFTSLWDESSLLGTSSKGILQFYTGGDDARCALEGSPTSKANQFVQALADYFPEAATTYTGEAVRTNWLRDPFSLGAYASFAPGQLTQFGEFGWFDDPADPASRTEVRFGDVLFAGEHTDVDWYGFMNGGASSGRQAAASVLRGLGII